MVGWFIGWDDPTARSCRHQPLRNYSLVDKKVDNTNKCIKILRLDDYEYNNVRKLKSWDIDDKNTRHNKLHPAVFSPFLTLAQKTRCVTVNSSKEAGRGSGGRLQRRAEK